MILVSIVSAGRFLVVPSMHVGQLWRSINSSHHSRHLVTSPILLGHPGNSPDAARLWVESRKKSFDQNVVSEEFGNYSIFGSWSYLAADSPPPVGAESSEADELLSG